jgi:hypothetical protein
MPIARPLGGHTNTAIRFACILQLLVASPNGFPHLVLLASTTHFVRELGCTMGTTVPTGSETGDWWKIVKHGQYLVHIVLEYPSAFDIFLSWRRLSKLTRKNRSSQSTQTRNCSLSCYRTSRSNRPKRAFCRGSRHESPTGVIYFGYRSSWGRIIRSEGLRRLFGWNFVLLEPDFCTSIGPIGSDCDRM